MKSSRTVLAAAVAVLASVAILVTLLAHYANVLTNSSSFSSRAVRVVHSGAVQSLIVDTVTGRVLDETGNQPGAQQLINEAVRAALSNRQIIGEIRAAARTLQTELDSGHADALTLTLPAIGSAMAPTIESRSPQLAEAVSRIGTVTVVDLPIPSSAASAVHDLATIGRDSTLLIVLSAALVALALILTAERRRTLRWLGLGALVSGLLAAAIYLLGRWIVVDQFSGSAARTAAHAAWGVYLGGLETSGLVVAVIGALVAIGAWVVRRTPQYEAATSPRAREPSRANARRS